ncbi:MAG TPA: hypothetical protein VE631_01325, partial [Alphaproteobacteria bacterium]|nr:hypothetical protein [Alphaproteobacteria bacterium]
PGGARRHCWPGEYLKLKRFVRGHEMPQFPAAFGTPSPRAPAPLSFCLLLRGCGAVIKVMPNIGAGEDRGAVGWTHEVRDA